MEWTEAVGSAIAYIEEHMTEDITAQDIAKQAHISPFYFQKGFSLLCGYTIGEYIRNRRLTLAAGELIMENVKVIDVAVKYCYDSPDSFTKAFCRFHGATPSMVQKNPSMMKSFAPLKIKLTLKGGYKMNYKLMKKESFTVIGTMRKFSYEEANTAIPACNVPEGFTTVTIPAFTWAVFP